MHNRIRGGRTAPETKRIRPAALRLSLASIACLILFLVLASQSLAVTSTRYIRSNGGDCASIGVWNQSTKTCTLSGDLTFGATNGIVIDAEGVTLDGAGHTITGAMGYTSGASFLSDRM